VKEAGDFVCYLNTTCTGVMVGICAERSASYRGRCYSAMKPLVIIVCTRLWFWSLCCCQCGSTYLLAFRNDNDEVQDNKSCAWAAVGMIAKLGRLVALSDANKVKHSPSADALQEFKKAGHPGNPPSLSLGPSLEALLPLVKVEVVLPQSHLSYFPDL